MRWLVLLLLLTATPAHALVGSTGRLAVFFEGDQVFAGTASSASNGEYAASLLTLARSAPPMDFFNARTRTWNTDNAVDDSTWFRQRYDAVLLMHNSGQASGITVVSTQWSTNFQDDESNAGIIHGPLSGRWPIPVFSICPDRIVPTTTTYDDSSTNAYVAGILNASPAGSFAAGHNISLADGGTWRWKLLTRIRSQLDTLYAYPGVMACVPATWSGPGTTAALAFADTTFGGAGRCAAGDTAVAGWRYRPRDDVPGIYYFTFVQNATSNTSLMMALQYIYSLTPIKPRGVIEIPLMLHNPETTAATNATYEATAQAIFDTCYAQGLKWNLMTHTHPTNYGTDWTATGLTRIRDAVNTYRWVWHPFSSNAGWTHEFYTTSDTAGFRSRWNQLHRTATHADSFALPASRLSDRIVTAGGITGTWLAGTLKDSGVNIVESTISTPNAAGWALQVSSSNEPTTYLIPGDDDERTIGVEFAAGLAHDTSFTQLRTATGYDEHQYVGREWLQDFWTATQVQSSLYFHGGGSTGVFRMDPYFAWLMSVLGKHFQYFNKVVRPKDWN